MRKLTNARQSTHIKSVDRHNRRVRGEPMQIRSGIFSVETHGVVNERAACLFLEPNIDGSYETGRRHNTASHKLLHKHELPTAKDRVLWSRSPMPAIALDHHMRVIAGGDGASLPPASAWASSRYLQIWTATIQHLPSDRRAANSRAAGARSARTATQCRAPPTSLSTPLLTRTSSPRQLGWLYLRT